MKLSIDKEMSLSPKKKEKIVAEKSMPIMRKIVKFKPPF
jgi:hypothetical protein